MNNNEIGGIGKHLDVVRKRIDMLKEIQTQHDELETKFFEEKAALEAKYQKLYQPLYAKRYDIVNGVVDVEESIAGENPTDEKGVPDFWLNAMKNNEVLAEEISGSDKEALKFLKDIKWSKGDNPKVFNLEFCFDTNPFFKNTVLTKTYQVIDEEDGPILERAIGTEIEWLPGKSLTQKIVKKKPKKGSKNVTPYTITEQCESFFNFFSPLQVPGADMDDDEAEDLRNLMEQDFDIGSTIRDEIIPHAVSWFTGEAAGYEYDDMEEDEEEDPVDEDEEDEEEDEEDDDDEDESTTEKKLSAGKRIQQGPAVDGQQGEQPPECKQQ